MGSKLFSETRQEPGLSGMLRDIEIGEILERKMPVEDKAKLLVAEANRKGGQDNISLILVEI